MCLLLNIVHLVGLDLNLDAKHKHYKSCKHISDFSHHLHIEVFDPKHLMLCKNVIERGVQVRVVFHFVNYEVSSFVGHKPLFGCF